MNTDTTTQPRIYTTDTWHGPAPGADPVAPVVLRLLRGLHSVDEPIGPVPELDVRAFDLLRRVQTMKNAACREEAGWAEGLEGPCDDRSVGDGVRFYHDATMMRLWAKIRGQADIAAFVEALETNPWRTTPIGAAALAYRQGMLLNRRGDPEEALLVLHTAHDRYNALGLPFDAALVRMEMCSGLLTLGDVASAIDLMLTTVDPIVAEGTPQQAFSIRTNLAYTYVKAGHARDGIVLMERILAESTWQTDPRPLVTLYRNLALTLRGELEFDRARWAYEQALALMPDEWTDEMTLGTRAAHVDLLSRMGLHDEAERLIAVLERDHAGFRSGAMDVRVVDVEMISVRGRMAMRLERFDEAIEHFERAASMAQALESMHGLLNSHMDLMTCYDAVGRFEDSLAHADRLFELQERVLATQARSAGRTLALRSSFDRKLHDLSLVQERERSRTMVDTHERVATRIATDLHDGVGQSLAACRLRLREARRHVSGPTGPLVDMVLDQVDTAAAILRSVSHELSSTTLTTLGFGPAIRELIDEANAAGPQRYEGGVYGPVDTLPADVALALYRSAQALLANVREHSGARNASLQVMLHSGRGHLIVEDDGCGFDPLDDAASGHGLRDVGARVQIVGGTLTIDSAPGYGTVVSVDVPIPSR